jgi:prepilin peptidase CpaA
MVIGVAFLLVAAYWNFRNGVVPNWLIVVFLLSFAPAAWFTEMPIDEIKLRATVFTVTLVVFIWLFSLNMAGGGAAKLVAVTALWLPWPTGLLFSSICVALAGGLELAEQTSDAPAIDLMGREFATVAAALGILLIAVKT